jgi:hypothetical protein
LRDLNVNGRILLTLSDLKRINVRVRILRRQGKVWRKRRKGKWEART